MLSVDRILHLINRQQPEPHAEWGTSKQAAVLVPMLMKDGEWHLLLTKRTDFLPTHKGQISFPGGKAETDDVDSISTALRETKEEVGIDNGRISIAGRMTDFVTHYGVIISPVVGILQWPSHISLSKGEVSRVFTIPLEWFADSENEEERMYSVPGRSSRPVLYYREYHGDTVWGITALIIHQLIRVLKK